ncbi:PRC and DUF2382 domain-containing protein [Cryobacterium sp. PH31-O1]|uniref:PRC and DUF2382 domain-containing protein n=1 Tax=Cryobacterium sp. PH31-O1 TaxID=3046306 RepID=UPI0024BAF10F|nr:PRC and DUF2382 domain-containing protein [Cryobacterium sp. PH31-O1]MDJ0337917.1 PRC and DUF2382 domain-containing protein [Cryobacterium sp. PH31-O1]
MINTNNVNDLIGADVYGIGDDKIGSVGQVYVDSDTQAPTWVTVKTGLFGGSETFAPLDDATFDDGIVRVMYEKSRVKDALRIDDDGALSEEEESSLYRYYGKEKRPGVADSGVYDQDADSDSDATTGYDTSGPTTDTAMTRSEERLLVGTQKVETGRARLRKHIVTENVTTTVPVSHEEVTLQREPITDANRGDATAGPELSEEEHEVVLTGERVVTSKETVPVERVALGTETITEQQQVNAAVSHEEIELVDPDTDTAPTK